jgi:ATP:ADP antiporter, AAA family
MSGAEAADSPQVTKPKNIAEKVLSLLAEVRAGEGAGVLLLGLNVFVLLGAYYLLKTVREALILSESGAEVKAYSSAAQAMLFLIIVPAYGALASRVNRIRLISWVTLAFASNLLIFYGFGAAGAREGVPFFIWVGIFNMLIVAQFWAFANDLYSESQGKRLFPVIMLGASLGAVAGGQAAARLIGPLGPYGLMLLAAGLLIPCILISLVIHRRAVSRSASVPGRSAASAEAPLAKTSALRLLARDRYLLLIAVMMLVLNTVNTTGEFLLGKFVEQAAQAASSDVVVQARLIGEFYGNFSSLYNGLGMLLQMFAVSRIFKYIGVRGALFILPCIALAGYSFILFLPLLGVIRWAKILENGTDYSIQNTTRQALFLSTSRVAKYKAKAAIDTFFVRAGDVVQAGIVLAGTGLGLGVKGYASVNLVLTLIWLALAAGVARANRRQSQGEAASRLTGTASQSSPDASAVVRPAGA